MNNESQKVLAKEEIVLSKFEGDALPENEIERITVVNDTVVSHDVIENGSVVGPVEDGLTGKDGFGIYINNNAKEVE